MHEKVRKAAALVDNILSQQGGSDLLFIANIYYQMTQCELDPILNEQELLSLTERLVECARGSTVPILTAERCDAVRFMLEYGISSNMSPELDPLSADQAKEFLLSCDRDVFIDLVDVVAVDAQSYYAPDMGSIGNTIDHINASICKFLQKKETGIDSLISSASEKSSEAFFRGTSFFRCPNR